MQPWALVTPASRGIGLELARRLLQTTKVPVIATARGGLDQTRENVLTGLDGVEEERLKVLKVDVVDEQSIQDAASQISTEFDKKTHYLHLALCIPGILYPEKSPSQIDYAHALQTFQVNTLGPMMLIKHFSPFLPKKAAKLSEQQGLPKTAVWANMSARVGSITDNTGLGGWYSYRASKAGVNQLTRTFDNLLKMQAGENAMSVALHPGTVKTGLSKDFWSNVKEEKLFSVEFSAEKLMEVVNSRTVKDRGRCWDWKGEEIPP